MNRNFLDDRIVFVILILLQFYFYVNLLSFLHPLQALDILQLLFFEFVQFPLLLTNPAHVIHA